jgi:hypothetical protein
LQQTLIDEGRDVEAIIGEGIKKLEDYYDQAAQIPAYLLGVGE